MKLVDIKYKGMDELLKLAKEQAQLLYLNAEGAVAKTVLFGVSKIANDCSVDTGRARASITGELAAQAGVDLQGDSVAIEEGKRQSVTGFSGLEGRIGSNVEYILHIEYRGEFTGNRKKITAKQRRYLFAKGILVNVGGQVVYKNPKRYKSKKGKGMFRKNIPILQNYLNEEMDEAIKATREGRLLRKVY